MNSGDIPVLIRVGQLSKAYCRTLKRSLWYGMQDIAAEIMARDRSRASLRPDEFWAVEAANFMVRRGECLGVIGHNGAGKTTLLKLLSGLVKPDRGRVELHGRVGALIELGSGMSPVLTGRENIYVIAAVLGLTKRETDRRFSSIEEFADIGDFLDAPVQSYSSGMKVRLGFSVAAHLDPDILLIDEILAVGDAEFRVKCYNRIDELRDRCAVVFVSHAMPHVARLAKRTIVLNRGRIIFDGNTTQAIEAYNRTVRVQSRDRLGSGEARITSFEILTEGSQEAPTVAYGSEVRMRLDMKSTIPIEAAIVDIVFHSIDGVLAAECNNFVRPVELSLKSGRPTIVHITIPCFSLNPGRYAVSALLMSSDMTKHNDWLRNLCTVNVVGERPALANQQFVARWKVV